MSDLHKQFLKRVEEREASMGLLTLSEDGAPTFNRIRKRERNDKNHHQILQAYHAARSQFESHRFEMGSLTLQVYYKPYKEENKQNKPRPTYVFNHGAGSSSMSFAVLATYLPSVLMYDMRGHGNSSPSNDYSLNTLTQDFKFIIDIAKQKFPIDLLFLIGHSLGGCVLTNYLMNYQDLNVKGLIMLDIVEETAVSSLSAMPSYIDKLPPSFLTYEDAISWHRKNGLLNNLESAKLSIPDLFIDDGEKLYWKTKLKDTQPHWDTWFKKLSPNFITCGGNKIAKLLVLAGHESLDKELMIGQMQGKYQLVVFHAGHFLQEDVPRELSICLKDFARRVIDPEGYMKQELGIVPKWGGLINK